MNYYLTKGGKVLTDKDIEALADEAEAGYVDRDGALVPVQRAVLHPPMEDRIKVVEFLDRLWLLHKAVEGDEPETRMDAHPNRVLLCSECDLSFPCPTMEQLGKLGGI